jgi:hypothetical protein
MPVLINSGISMSKKSDSDNRSNQLNPNNSEYWNCRGGGNDGSDMYGDYDDAGWPQRTWSGFSYVPPSPSFERNWFYFAGTSFDGTAVYVRFQTEVKVSSLSTGSAEALALAEDAKDTLLRHMHRRCPLGVAYWRLASNQNRGKFYWYTPASSESTFETRPDVYGGVEWQKMSSWYSAIRHQSQQLDLLFDWGKHDEAVDLGVIMSEVITFAPETEDLTRWIKQASPEQL